MNSVERFENTMLFESVDRLPIIEWAPYWDKTLERWYSEGLLSGLRQPEEIRECFELDRYLQLWIPPQASTCPQPSFHGAGILKDEDDYNNLKSHLYPNPAFDKNVLEKWANEQQNGDAVVWFTYSGFFWHPRELFGIETHMYAFFDKPELMHKMNDDLVEFHLRILDEICSICSPSFMTFAEDMSYNHGPMISKDCFDEFLAPYYHRIIPELKKRNILVLVDSDGDVSELIPWLKEVGIEGILPLERMAGVDVVQIRRKHPNFKMIGAFDKTVIHLGEKAIRREFERLLPVMKQGGFIPSVDHQTPPEVSLENYRCYVRLLKQYCEKAVAS